MPATNTQGMQQRRQRTNLVHLCATSPIKVTVEVEGKPLTMELDTGAAVSIVSDARIFPDLQIKHYYFEDLH